MNMYIITTIKAQSSEERPLTLNFKNYSIKYFCKFRLPMDGIIYREFCKFRLPIVGF